MLGLLAAILLPKIYTATSTVQLEQQTPQVIAAPGLDPEPEDANRFLQTQLDRIESRSLAKEVAMRVRLEQSPAIIAALGRDLATTEARLTALQEGVRAELGLNTRIARLSFESLDPEVSALLANAYAEALIADNLRGKVETSRRAQDYLLERLGEAKTKLEDSERRLLDYSRRAGLTSTAMGAEEANGATMPGRQIEQLSANLASATSRRIDAEQEWNQVRSASPTLLPQVQENRAYQEMLSQKAQLQAELADERERRTDEYPTVAAKATKVRELDREISRLESAIKQSIQQRYRYAARQEAQLRSTIDQLREAAMAEQERGIGYNSLEREVETNRIAFDGLLQRLREVSAAAGAPAANVALVDRAEPPVEPSSASPIWIMAVATIAGLIGGTGIALVRETSTSVIRSVDDLESAVDLTVLGVVPLAEKGKGMIELIRDRRSPQSEAFKAIAATLQQSTGGPIPRSLLLTSTVANEGKSTSTLGLARGLSALGYRVIVVNGDLRNPSSGPGLADALEGTAPPRDLVLVNGRSRIGIVDAGTTDEDLVGLLQPSKLRPVIDQLTDIADIVLVDAPPVLGLADAVLLAGSVDFLLMVVEANRVGAAEFDMALARLPEKVPGAAILTKFDARKAGTTYGDTSYYSYGRSRWDLQVA